MGQLHTDKTLCNAVQEVPYKLAQEKILFNAVLILLGQYGTDKKLAQCCPIDSRQQKNSNIAQKKSCSILS